MKKVSIIGVDLAKNVFQLHGAAADGMVLFRKKLTRLQCHRFTAEQPACLVAMEACGGAHYWAREMRRLGHDIRLIECRAINKLAAREGSTAVRSLRHVLSPMNAKYALIPSAYDRWRLCRLSVLLSISLSEALSIYALPPVCRGPRLRMCLAFGPLRRERIRPDHESGSE